VLLLLLANTILHNHHSHSLNSSAHVPNPRAVHPDGRPPTIAQAKKKVKVIEQNVFSLKADDEDVVGAGSGTGDADTGPVTFLVDGNNIRNSFGFEAVSALQLTKKLSSWSRTPQPQVICFWDGGSQKKSNLAMSMLSVFSGPDDNADNLMVQCCSFLSHQLPNNPSKSSLQTLSSGDRADDDGINIHQRQKQTILVFTSDANLANRCKMQLLEESSANQPRTKSDIHCQIYHSICLKLLLEDQDGQESDESDSASPLGTSANASKRKRKRIDEPDWQREERRSSVMELQSFLESDNLTHRNCDKDGIIQFSNNQEVLSNIFQWINNGFDGLGIGRVTKGGSVLYQIKE
jgi:hypothetical protein